MKFPELTEVEGKIADRRKALSEIFADAKNDDGALDLSKVKGFGDDSAEVASSIRKLNDELTDLGGERDSLLAIRKGAENAQVTDERTEEGGSDRRHEAAKGYLDRIMETGVLKSKGRFELNDVDVKTVFSTSAGWDPEVTRTGTLIYDAQRQPVGVIDLLPTTTTTQASVAYMEETTFTNAAAETAEAGAKPEGALALTEVTEPVRKIAVVLPVTDEQLEDEPRVRGYIENRLPFMVRQRLSAQVITGNGTPPNLSGVLDRSGIQTQAKSTDPTPDAIHKAMTKVMVTGQAMPNAVVFHPNDWQDVRLLRTSDGIYIWGSPSEAGPERIWGLSVVKDQALTENTALVGDWNYSELAVRSGLSVEIGYNADDWTKNKQTFRAEMRAAFLVYRPAAFCTVTGI